MTEYEYYSVFQKWLNTNTNTIWLFKNDTIRIRILFVFPKITEYEYEYSSTFQKWPNTNTILLFKNDRIRTRLLFGFSKMTKHQFIHHHHHQHHPLLNSTLLLCDSHFPFSRTALKVLRLKRESDWVFEGFPWIHKLGIVQLKRREDPSPILFPPKHRRIPPPPLPTHSHIHCTPTSGSWKVRIFSKIGMGF